MAVKALLSMFLSVGGTDISDHVRDCNVTADATALSSEAMGDAWEEVTGGAKSGMLNFTVLDDFAASAIDSVIWSAFNTGTNVAFEVRPDSAVVGTSNPKYTGSVHPGQWRMGGQYNTMAQKQLSWKISGALTRATS